MHLILIPFKYHIDFYMSVSKMLGFTFGIQYAYIYTLTSQNEFDDSFWKYQLIVSIVAVDAVAASAAYIRFAARFRLPLLALCSLLSARYSVANFTVDI